VASFAGALAMLPFAIAGALPAAFGLSVLLALALIIIASAFMSWVFGVRSARASLAGQSAAR
jgi:hypothetical protein